MLKRTIIAIAAYVVVTLTLASCSQGPSNAIGEALTTPRASASTSPAAGTTNAHVSVTCSAVAAIANIVDDAVIRRSKGKLDQASYEAILVEIEVPLRGLKLNRDAGLQSDVFNLYEAVTSGGQAPGAVFDPSSSDYLSSIAAITSACNANRTPIELYGSSAAGG